MDWFTRLVLRLLGCQSHKGIDARGDHYEGWVRPGGKMTYFHVYHEANKGNVIRPVWKEKPRGKQKA